MISYCKLEQRGSLESGGWRLKPGKGLQARLLKADWCCVSREHEKEVQNRKRGKRPRGRPRKHTVMSSCSRRSKLKVSGYGLCTASFWLLTHLCCFGQKFFRGAIEVGRPLSCCPFRPLPVNGTNRQQSKLSLPWGLLRCCFSRPKPILHSVLPDSSSSLDR